MGKSRKSTLSSASAPPAPVPEDEFDRSASRKRIRDYTDVADSDDEFHLNRDQILLGEEPEAKRRRKWAEQEEFLEMDGEEVLGLNEDEEEEEEDYDGEEEYYSDDDALDNRSKRRVEADGDEDEEAELGWGMAKGDIYGADAIETEEQALEEEAEALRLQKKQLQSMSAADYGFDELDDASDQHDMGSSTVVTEVLPQLHITEDMGPAERLKLLKSRYPEFEPLSKELLRMQDIHAELEKKEDMRPDRPNHQTKMRAAAAYLASLTMYFVLMSSPASTGHSDALALSASQLRDHPVMDSLVRCRELWQKAEKLPSDLIVVDVPPSLDANEVDAPDVVAEEKGDPKSLPVKLHSTRKSRAQRHAEALAAADQARRAERMRKTEADLAGLEDVIATAARKKRKPSKLPTGDDNSDMGEEAPLTAQEAAEKARHRKSLRFYTSQIAQKAAKRDAAGRHAGGDDDLPYRERLRDRQARLNAEAEKRGGRDTAADLGGESDEEDARQAKALRAEDNDADADAYYDLIASRTAKKKADGVARAEAEKQAALLGNGARVVEETTLGPDGKRKITYAIEKNKGLTPHRKKEARNPRVKKRKKFEQKNKKLASIKPVWKGGEGRGGYGGELTGIKKGLVKSTKL